MDWRQDHPLYRVINLATGQQIEWCFFADDETGEYGVYNKSPSGGFYVGADGRISTSFSVTRLSITPLRPGEPYLLADVNDPNKWQKADES